MVCSKTHSDAGPSSRATLEVGTSKAMSYANSRAWRTAAIRKRHQHGQLLQPFCNYASHLFHPATFFGLFGIEPWRAALEFASHHIALAEANPAAGDGHPAIIFPGMGTGGTAVAPLRGTASRWATKPSTGGAASIGGPKATSTPGWPT